MTRPQLTSAYAALQHMRREPLLISDSPWLQLRLISGRLRAASTSLRELNDLDFLPGSLASLERSETPSTMLEESARQ